VRPEGRQSGEGVLGEAPHQVERLGEHYNLPQRGFLTTNAFLMQ